MWSSILYQPYNSTTESIFALDGTYRKRIEGSLVFEWGIDEPEFRPTIEVGSGTGLTGDYNVKYTYCRKERGTLVSESNPSNEATAAVTLANEDLKVTFTEPTDEQVNFVRFYRTQDSGSTYYYDTEFCYATGDYGCTQLWEVTDEYLTEAIRAHKAVGQMLER